MFNQELNLIIGEAVSLVVQECINHFNTPRKRIREDDERYLFNTQELELVMANINNPESIDCKVITDDCNNFFCYQLSRKRNK